MLRLRRARLFGATLLDAVQTLLQDGSEIDDIGKPLLLWRSSGRHLASMLDFFMNQLEQRRAVVIFVFIWIPLIRHLLDERQRHLQLLHADLEISWNIQ